jgi:hypothetical protein
VAPAGQRCPAQGRRPLGRRSCGADARTVIDPGARRCPCTSAEVVTPEVEAQGTTTRALDLDAGTTRHGAQTRGGIGVSVPLPA